MSFFGDAGDLETAETFAEASQSDSDPNELSSASDLPDIELPTESTDAISMPSTPENGVYPFSSLTIP